MFNISSNDLVLSIIIIIIFSMLAFIYKLSIDIELLKEDISKLMYPGKDSE